MPTRRPEAGRHAIRMRAASATCCSCPASVRAIRAANAIPGNVADADGRVRRYDIEAQARAVFANVRAVLEASGARWEDLVDVTVYLTDMARDFRAYNAVWAEYFPDADHRALPHHRRHHRAADADRDRTQVHRGAAFDRMPD